MLPLEIEEIILKYKRELEDYEMDLSTDRIFMFFEILYNICFFIFFLPLTITIFIIMIVIFKLNSYLH